MSRSHDGQAGRTASLSWARNQEAWVNAVSGEMVAAGGFIDLSIRSPIRFAARSIGSASRNSFKRDYRREKASVLGKKLDTLLMDAISLLAADAPLPARYVDHPLAGEWPGFRSQVQRG